MSFGLRFCGVSAMSFGIATSLTYYHLNQPSHLEGFDFDLVISTSQLALFLILTGYYWAFKTPLKTRLSSFSYLIYLAGALLLASLSLIQGLEIIFDVGYLDFTILLWTVFLPLSLAYLPPFLIYQFQKIREHPTYRQLFLEGQGASSEFASVGTYSKLRGKLNLNVFTYWFSKKGMTTDGLFIGRTLLADDPFRRPVVIKDQDHHICIGKSGSGKFISALSFFLSAGSNMSSILCLDVKGELSLATANRRHHQNIGGQGTTTKHFPNGRVTIFDPFTWIAKQGFPSTCYNVLKEIKVNSPYARSLLSAISDGLFPPEDVEQMHFKEVPKIIFEGFVAHVLTAFPEECQNLPFVYDLIRGINPETGLVDLEYYQKLLLDMSKNNAMGGLPQEAARVLIEMGGNERGSMQTTLSRHLKWIGDPQMKAHLQDGDFTFWDFGVKTIHIDGEEMDLCETVYIVIPDQLIQDQMRYARVIFNLGIRIMQFREKKPKRETLVLLDEFPRLGGNIDVVTEGFGILRSYGIRLIVFLQTLGQLKDDYPKRWSSMIGNSTTQFFGVRDKDTAEYISQMLGSRLIRRYERKKTALGFSKKVIVSETVRELLTPAEVMLKLKPSSNMQIIFSNKGLPMRLERLAFKPMKIDSTKFKALGLGGLKKQIEDEE